MTDYLTSSYTLDWEYSEERVWETLSFSFLSSGTPGKGQRQNKKLIIETAMS